MFIAFSSTWPDPDRDRRARARARAAGLALTVAVAGVVALYPHQLPPEVPHAGPVTVAQVAEKPDAGPELVVEEEDLTDLDADGSVRPHGPSLPERPVEGQRRPPCDPELQVAINGACWVPHKRKPPCGPKMYEHNGDCLLPAAARPRMPASVEQ